MHSVFEPCEDTKYIQKMGEDCLKIYYSNLTAATDHHSFCRFVKAKPFLKEATVKIIVAYFYFWTTYECFKLWRKREISKHIICMRIFKKNHTFTTTDIRFLVYMYNIVVTNKLISELSFQNNTQPHNLYLKHS